tara:strand:+ start:501 stop:818 length:318 start_codon:yes stop_codon:yes gene_type:complete
MHYKNNCQTIRNYDLLGRPVYKNKRQFSTHDLAVQACKVINLREHQIHKLVTYKCNVCHQYHIGRNGKEINAKYKRKIRREREAYHKPTPLREVNLKIRRYCYKL